MSANRRPTIGHASCQRVSLTEAGQITNRDKLKSLRRHPVLPSSIAMRQHWTRVNTGPRDTFPFPNALLSSSEGGRDQIGMVAAIKSVAWPRSNRNRWPRCIGIRILLLGRPGKRDPFGHRHETWGQEPVGAAQQHHNAVVEAYARHIPLHQQWVPRSLRNI